MLKIEREMQAASLSASPAASPSASPAASPSASPAASPSNLSDSEKEAFETAFWKHPSESEEKGKSLADYEDKQLRLLVVNGISTIATRAGAVLILLFLVQILVTLYRYNVRLANFYDGRADALQLMSSKDEKSFKTLVETIGGDIIEFGKVPKTPTEHAIVLATKFLQVAQSKKD
jgi:hypothetical protein